MFNNVSPITQNHSKGDGDMANKVKTDGEHSKGKPTPRKPSPTKKIHYDNRYLKSMKTSLIDSRYRSKGCRNFNRSNSNRGLVEL